MTSGKNWKIKRLNHKTKQKTDKTENEDRVKEKGESWIVNVSEQAWRCPHTADPSQLYHE